MIIEYIKPGSKIYNDILNILFILYAGLLPFSNAFDTHTGPYLIMLFWILEGNFKEKLDIFKSYPALPLLTLFFTISAISFLWSDNFYSAKKEFEYYFVLFSIFTAISTSIKAEYIKIAIYTFLISMFISEIYSYGIFFDIFHPKGADRFNPTPPYIHHLRYSIFLAVTALILLSMVTDSSKSIKWRLPEGLFLLSTTANLFMNGGRTGQLAFIVAVIIFIIFKYGMNFKRLAITLLSLSAILITAYYFSPVFNNRVHSAISDIDDIFTKSNLQNSWGERIAMKIVAIDLISKYPLFGEGIGDAMDSYREDISSPPMDKYSFTAHVPHVHDQFLQIAIQSGVINMLIFISFILYLFFMKCQSKENQALLKAVVVIFIIGSLTDVILRNYNAGLFAFVFTLLALRCKKELDRATG